MQYRRKIKIFFTFPVSYSYSDTRISNLLFFSVINSILISDTANLQKKEFFYSDSALFGKTKSHFSLEQNADCFLYVKSLKVEKNIEERFKITALISALSFGVYKSTFVLTIS